MALMLKPLRTVMTAALLTIATYGVAAELAGGHPDTYVVKKGDTLWDIAGRFLKKPWLWPEIWQDNSQVKNPHLIYPGDELVISGRHLGRGGFGPHVRGSGYDEAVPPIPLSALKQWLKNTRIVAEDEYRDAPHVVAIEENQLRGTPGQLVYVRGLNAAPGTKLALVRPSGRYYDMHTITLAEALELFKLPRNLGLSEAGEEVSVGVGRFGPFVKQGTTYASLKPEDDPYTIELERALQLVREKAEMIANRTIRDFGNGIQVLNGRYGPYITDGDKNARIPKDKEPSELTEAECVELLAAAPFRPKRGGGRFGKGKGKAVAKTAKAKAPAAAAEKAPAKKAAAKKAPAKKAAAKKTTKKKAAAKKAPAKKVAAKKNSA